MKGAFGGGFAIVGIPLLSLAMDPIAAGALLAPLFVVMDVTALRYWRPNTWSPRRPCDAAAGARRRHRARLLRTARSGPACRRRIVMGAVTLAFAALWLLGGGEVRPRPRSRLKAMLAGFSSGVTTMVAHSGETASLRSICCRSDMSKALYAGTTSLFFTVGNLRTELPWLVLVTPSKTPMMLMALCVPAVPGRCLGRMARCTSGSTSARSTAPVTPFWSSPRPHCSWDGLAGYARA